VENPTEEELAARFEPILQQELAELRRSSAQTAADRDPVELDQQSVGRLSRMDSLQMQAMANAVEQRRRNRSVLIERALRRIEEGEFGFCLSCGDFIGWRRLEIDPVTTQCVDCASGKEKA
jgi:DnaK suppressor protein